MGAAQVNPLQVKSSELAFDDNLDVQELSLLLQGSEFGELLEAARQEGLTAAALVRYLVRDYLCWTRSGLGAALGRELRTTGVKDPGVSHVHGSKGLYRFKGRGCQKYSGIEAKQADVVL
jgi:hypothetical protein